MRIVLDAALIVVLAGCALVPAPSPGTSEPTATTSASAPPDGLSFVPPSSTSPEGSAALGTVLGPWQPDRLPLGDPQIAVISDACAAAARDQLGEAEADLPTAVVDARGLGLATAILADDARAIECLVAIDGSGASRVDSVIRLAPSLSKPVNDTSIAIVSLVDAEDLPGGRTVVIGRAGADASGVSLPFAGGPTVGASVGGGWYVAWWPGQRRPATIDAADATGLVLASAGPPAGEVDGALGAASWWLDPEATAVSPDTVSIHALVLEEACASGKTPEGRIEGPLVNLSEIAVTVTIGVRPLPGTQDCQGNAPFPFAFKLPEPLAGRTLLDGGEVPPRDASKPPVG